MNNKDIIAANIFRYNELKHCIDLMEDIPYAIIKGEPLSILAYKKTGMRKYGDIDILVTRNDLKKIENVLSDCGFECACTRYERLFCLTYSYQILPYIKRIGNLKINIDLQYDIFWGEYEGERIKMDDFLSDTIEIIVYNTKLKTLPIIKTFIQLILHHYKEMNSIYHICQHNPINSKMFADVYYLWKNNISELTLSDLYKISSEYNIMPYVYYMLFYTNQIFNDIELIPYIEKFKNLEGEKILYSYGLEKNERKMWRVDFHERLDHENLYDFIKDDLTIDDIKKLKINKKIFG